MKNHHNAIRNWNNMKNNATPAESRIKTYVPPLQEEIQSPVVEEEKITTSTVETTTTMDPSYNEELTTSTTTETTTESNKTRLPNFTNKK